MPSAELQVVIEGLKSGPSILGPDIAQMRENMETMAGAIPLPDDLTFEPVDAGGVPAEWAAAPTSRADRAVVYFHGGGYAIGSVRSHRLLVGGIARAARARVLSVDYRLAPEHAFPAAVEDGVAAVRFARDTGIDPARLAVAGDSAGGGLTAATLLALRDGGDPLPAAGVCISPWLDLTCDAETYHTKADVDPMVTQEGLRAMAAHYLAGADAKTPLASPLFADLAGLPPLLVHVGTAEVLLDDSRRFAERAAGAGVDVTLEVWDDMIHVWHAFSAVLPEARQAVERVGAFLEERLG